MALYNYSLYLLRESARGPFVADLESAGLIRIAGDDIEFLGLNCSYSITQDADGVAVLDLAPNEVDFERLIGERGAELVGWLWRAMEQAGVLYAFIPVGGDVKYYEDGVSTDKLAWTQLPELLETGTVRVVHPLMMFAERLGQSRPCAKAKQLDWGLHEYREGIGCLLALTEPTEHGFEILEPGTTYPLLRQVWA